MFYEKVFDFIVVECLVFEGFMLIYLSNFESEFEFELMVNCGWMELYVLGDGYGYIVFFVDDFEVEYVCFELFGFSLMFLKELKFDGRLLVWFFFV